MTRETPPDNAILSEDLPLDGAAVLSSQSVHLDKYRAADLSPELLVESYLAFVRHCTWSLVRPEAAPGAVSFTLLGSPLSLLIFTGPEYSPGEHLQAATLSIAGGVLVQPGECSRGMLTFTVEPGTTGTLVTIQVSDYCPLILGGTKPSRLRRWLYRCTQALIHQHVTVNFLKLLRTRVGRERQPAA